MSLTKAIQFRYLTTQLTHEERVGFLSKLVQTHLDVLFTSLFTHIVKTNQIREANHFNEALSDIINSRKETPKAVPTNNIQIHQLPRALIGYTASFLKRHEYVKFAMSNRAVYLGCNSPNLLHALDLRNIEDYSSINLAAFPSVAILRIEPIELPSNWSFDSPPFNQVNTLDLFANDSHGWVEQFLSLNIINYGSVTTLRCSDFGFRPPADPMQGNEFLNLLTRFPNITNIKLDGVFAVNITAQEIANLWPNLIGLYIDGGYREFNANLITLLASKLKYLAFSRVPGTNYSNSFLFDVTLDKLEELQARTPDQQSLNNILSSARNLNKILITHIRWVSPEDVRDGSMSNTEIKNTTSKLIVKCPLLESMCFAVKISAFSAMTQGIEYGLLKTKRQHRLALKIHICIWGEIVKTDEFMLNVGRIVNALESASTNDFMFIVQFYHDVGHDKVSETLKELDNIVSIDTNIFRYEHKFIIQNRNCKINGYRDVIFGECLSDWY
eukprot:616691_1